MRSPIWRGVLFLLLAANSFGARANLQTTSPLRHDLIVRIEPARGTMTVRDTIAIPVDRIEGGRVRLETASFITRLNPRLISGARALSATSRTERSRIEWDIVFAAIAPSARDVVIRVDYVVTGSPSPLLAIRAEGSLAGSVGNAWYPQLRYPAQDVGTLTVRGPAGERVIATGTVVNPPSEQASGTFVFRNPAPTKFAFAAGPYRQHLAPDGRFSIFTLRERATTGMSLERTSAAVAALTEIYGPMPYGAPALVEVNFPPGVRGLSERGFILADDAALDRYNLLYWCHELSHQWWGLAVRPEEDSPGMSLFTEALSEFSGLQVIEATDGPAGVTEIRTGRLSPVIRSPIEQYGEVAERGQDHSLRDWNPASQENSSVMHRLSTSKGASVLTMLADLVGRDLVYQALKAIIDRSSGGFATWRGVEEEINRTTGEDYGWFFEQWLGRPGIAELSLRWHAETEGREARGTISQISNLYRMPVEVDLVGADGELKTERIWLEGQHTPFAVAADFRIRHIILDPRYRLFRGPLPSDLRRSFVSDN